MKKTIKQRFFLSLCLLMLFSLFGGGNLAWAEGTTVVYTLDFTAKSAKSQIYDKDWTYSSNGIDWTINGAANNNANWAYVRTGGKTQKWSYYKSKSAIEEEISSLVLTALNTKSNNAFTMKSVKLTVASDADFTDIIDEVTLTDISTSMTFVPNEGKSWTNAYYKLYFTWSNTNKKNNYGMDVQKVDFYSAASTEPSITTSSSELSFGEVETTSNKPLSFTLSGQNLTADATLSIGGTNAEYFSVAPKSVSQMDGTIAERNVTVTYAPTAVGTHTATLQIKSGETIKGIALSGTGIAPLPTYNVSWMVNGVQTTKQVKEGTEIPFTDPDAASIPTGYSFVGWTDTQVEGKLTYAPTLVSSPVTASKDATYYAVFAVSKSTGNEVWEEITTVPKPGTYAILSDSYFMKAKITSKRFENGEATPEISDATPATLTTAPASDCIWEITKPDAYYRIAYGSQYAGGTSSASKNQGALLDDASSDLAKWTIEHNGSEFSVINYGRSSISDGTRKYLRNNTDDPTYGWACYTSGTGKAPRLFKKKNATVLTDYCTTIPDVELAVGATGYATLYYSNFDLVVPENAEAYTFRSKDGALMESKTYAADAVIPAGEAVVVHTLNGLSSTLNFKKGIATAACDPSSQLAGTDKKTAIAPDPDYYFYGLSLNSSSDPNSVGFYWMKDNGAAFTNGAHKAYLKIKKSEFTGTQSVRGFAFKGTATGVESVESSNNAPQAIYDLTGRRVSKAEKGIYIINGKKVIK